MSDYCVKGLKSERCSFQPINHTHHDQLGRLFQNPKAMKYYENGKPWDDEHFTRRFTCWVQRSESGRPSWWVVKATGNYHNVLAGIGFFLRDKPDDHPYFGNESSMEMAMVISPDFQRQNYAGEIITTILQNYEMCGRFNVDEKDSIIFYWTINPENVAALAVVTSMISIGLPISKRLDQDTSRFPSPRIIFYIRLNRINAKGVVDKLLGHSSDVDNLQPSFPPPYCEHEGLGSPLLTIEKLKFPMAQWIDIANVDLTSVVTKNRYLRCRLYGISEKNGNREKTMVAIHAKKCTKWELLICCSEERNQAIKWRLAKNTRFQKYILCVSLYECGKYEISNWHSVSTELYWNHIEFDCFENIPQVQKKNNIPGVNCWSLPSACHPPRRVAPKKTTTYPSIPPPPPSPSQTCPFSFPTVLHEPPQVPIEDTTNPPIESTPGNGLSPPSSSRHGCEDNNNKNAQRKDFDAKEYKKLWSEIIDRLPATE